jgi:hypothetical protein
MIAMILIVNFIVFVACIFASIDARITIKQEKEFLEKIIYQTEEYKEAVERLEKLKQELGYSQNENKK